jgi:tellurite resistance protein TerC
MLQHPALLVVFGVTVFIMLLLDLGVFNKKGHVISNKEALSWSIVWISLSMLFSGVIYFTYNIEDSHALAVEKFSQFQSAYWIEKALSMDNLFVFILVFKLFKVPSANQHKILFWGIIGALVFRAIFIFSGIELIQLTYLPSFSIGDWHFMIPSDSEMVSNFSTKTFYRPNVLLFLFGVFLLFSGIKSWSAHQDDEEDTKDFSKSIGARLVHRFFKVSDDFDGDKFFTVKNGIKMATPMLVVIMVIEFTDLLFAVDSIPAIFAIAPNDPYILYASNIFAILGLRSLYFLLANFMDMFSKLHYGLAIVLSFIGFKMIISPFFHIESSISLLIVGGVLMSSVLYSVFTAKKEKK